ncbi:MAG: cupin, partial [Rhodospirillales bacterium]|nr:cupin [Rhodospirillales bacterium]
WRNGVYPFHHFHANAHEVLGIAAGAAEVQFGGPSGPVLRVQAGDVVVLPAGIGHCRRSQTPDLLVVGGYPEGAPDPDLHRGAAEAHDAVVHSIAAVPMPAADPVAGRDGPLRRLWGEQA